MHVSYRFRYLCVKKGKVFIQTCVSMQMTERRKTHLVEMSWIFIENISLFMDYLQ